MFCRVISWSEVIIRRRSNFAMDIENKIEKLSDNMWDMFGMGNFKKRTARKMIP